MSSLFHYNYRITNLILRKHYYGSRSSKILPQLDIGVKYFSSSTNKEFISDQKTNPNNYKYKVVKVHKNRKDTILYEIKLHQKCKVNTNQSFYNKVIQPHQPNSFINTTGMIYIKSLSKFISTSDYDKTIHKFHTSDRVIVNDIDGNRLCIPCKVYNSNRDKYSSIAKNKVNSISKIDGSKKCISVEEYYSGEYYCNNTGKAPVTDNNGNTFLVSVNDPKYISGELTHVSKGLVTAIDLNTGKSRQVTKEEFILNENLVGPNYNRVGRENFNAKTIKIFDNFNNLICECVGNFKIKCNELNLPFNQLRISYTKNIPILRTNRNKHIENYIGWYAVVSKKPSLH